MRRRDFFRIGIAGVFSSKLASSFSSSSEFYLKFADSDTAVFPFRSGANAWWGFIDADGRVVASPETSHISGRLCDFYGGLAAMRFDDGSAWMIDTVGGKQFAIDPDNYGWNYALRDGLLPNRDRGSGKWGYVDRTGRPVIGANFDLAFPFSEERAVAQMGKLRGVIGPDGKWIATPGFSWAGSYQDGLLPVQRGARFLYLDRGGRPVFGRDFEQASVFTKGLAAVREGNQWGVIDGGGKLVVPFRYEAIWLSNDGVLLFQEGGLWGIMTGEGRVVVAPAFRAIEPFSCGRALVREGPGSSYFIGTDGARLFSYGSAERFVLDRAPVVMAQGNERAWVDRDGRPVFRWKHAAPNILQEQLGTAR